MSYSYEIVTDSTANLSEAFIDKYHISVLALSFYVEGKEYKGYVKGQTTDLNQFYSMMREKKDMKTSLANTADAYDCMKPMLEAGKDVICLAFSSGLSSTYQAVHTACEELKEEFPDRTIYCVDSLAAAYGEGLFVKYIVDLREEGKSIDEAFQWGMQHRLNMVHVFTVDDLFFLKRGGRISATTAVVGTALKVKPVLHVDDEGHLRPLCNVRGRKKALDTLVKLFEEKVENPDGQSIFISHGDCIEDAEYVGNKIKEKYNVKEVDIRTLDPVIGVHAGPGTVALFFYGGPR